VAPGWAESFLFVLAEKTGWTEEYLMRAPLVRLLKLYHAALWANGAWTVLPVKAGAGRNIDALFTNLQRVRDQDDDECD
jgi:hypothetical protein